MALWIFDDVRWKCYLQNNHVMFFYGFQLNTGSWKYLFSQSLTLTERCHTRNFGMAFS